MERKLPLVDIEGTPFYLDVMAEELRQRDNPQNTISFNVFDLDGNGYTFLFDTELLTAADNTVLNSKTRHRYKWVTLPALMELDPIGISLKYSIPLSALCPDMDNESLKMMRESDGEGEDSDEDDLL